MNDEVNAKVSICKCCNSIHGPLCQKA